MWPRSRQYGSVSQGKGRTWGPARPHTSRWTLRSFRNAGCSGRGRGATWELPGPSACCRPSAALCRWCSHWTGYRSCQLFLEWREEKRIEFTQPTSTSPLTFSFCSHIKNTMMLSRLSSYKDPPRCNSYSSKSDLLQILFLKHSLSPLNESTLCTHLFCC